MILFDAFDLALAAIVLGLAAWTITAREIFSAVVGYVAYGLLLAIVWVRLYAPDVALTEAAIGSGVTGVLLVAASTRLGRLPTPEAPPGAALKVAAAALSLLVAGVLAAAVLTLPDPAPSLAPEADKELAATGLGNAVTAVLIAYRSFDTMLEKVVLVLAVVGVWSVAPDRFWGGAPAPLGPAAPDAALVFLARILAPIGVVIGVQMFWVGADDPGGAFQGGAILAAMWIIVMMARLTEPPRVGAGWLRLGGDFGARGVPARWPRGTAHGRELLRLSSGIRQTSHPVHRSLHGPVDRSDAAVAGRGAAEPGGRIMSPSIIAAFVGAGLVGLGLYALIVNPEPLKKLLAFNLIGNGVFLVFGIVARRGAVGAFSFDPVPQAMVITGIVVAFAASALAVALMLRLAEESRRVTLDPDPWTKPDDGAEDK